MNPEQNREWPPGRPGLLYSGFRPNAPVSAAGIRSARYSPWLRASPQRHRNCLHEVGQRHEYKHEAEGERCHGQDVGHSNQKGPKSGVTKKVTNPQKVDCRGPQEQPEWSIVGFSVGEPESRQKEPSQRSESNNARSAKGGPLEIKSSKHDGHIERPTATIHSKHTRHHRDDI